MVGWHHRLNGREFEQVPEVVDGQGSLSINDVGKTSYPHAKE